MKTQKIGYIMLFIIINNEEFMDSRIKRSINIQNTIKSYIHRAQNWSQLKSAAVVSGHAGCGKTSLLLDHFKREKYFYFSFAGLEDNVAERLFTEKVSSVTTVNVGTWDEAFIALSQARKYIIFDDLAPIVSYKRFEKSVTIICLHSYLRALLRQQKKNPNFCFHGNYSLG